MFLFSGTKTDDVVIESSMESKIIKPNTGSIKISCRTGGAPNELYQSPLIMAHGDDNLFNNGNIYPNAKGKYNVTFDGFGGYRERNIYNAATFHGKFT